MDVNHKVKKLFHLILSLEDSPSLQSEIFQAATHIDKRWQTGGSMISDVDEAMSDPSFAKHYPLEKLNKIAERYPYLVKSEAFKNKVGSRYVNVKSECSEPRIDEWGLPVEEDTMSADVAPAQVVVPLGMVKAGNSTPIVKSKKKKKS